MQHDFRTLEQLLGPQAASFKDQIIITLVKRLAKDGRLVVPAAEIDATGQDLLSIEIDQKARNFTFNLRKKS